MRMRVSTRMATSSCLLLIIWTVFICNIQLTGCVHITESITSSNNSVSADVTVIGVDPKADTNTMPSTIETSPPPATWDAIKSLSQKGRAKRIQKVHSYNKPQKDKENWAKQQIGPTPIPMGINAAKGIVSHHKKAQPAGTTPTTGTTPTEGYNNQSKTYTSTLWQSVSHDAITERVSANVHAYDGNNVYVRDIDSISIVGTTKADKTYETSSTTTGYHARFENTTGTGKAVAVVVTEVTSTTMPTGLMENLHFNTKSNAKTMSTKHPVSDTTFTGTTKSITSIPRATLIPEHDKSLQVNASVNPSLSSLSSSQHTKMTAPPLHSTSSTTRTPPVSTSTATSSSTSSTTVVDGTVMPKLDVGHDGIKITKKKQLFDKHFIAITTSSSPLPFSGSLHSPITRNSDRDRDNPWPLSKTKPSKGGKKLMEVPNGYLGPIMMKEKTFSVSHHGKKFKPSLAEQLRDKKLIEIIAPTALMEPTPKVKSSVTLLSDPEFVPIESSPPMSTMAALPTKRSTSTTSTESSSSPVNYPTLVPTVATSKGDIEPEMATTYFLVITDDPKAHADSQMEKEIANQIVPSLLPEMTTGSPITTGYHKTVSTARSSTEKHPTILNSDLDSTISPSIETSKHLGTEAYSLTSTVPTHMTTDHDLPASDTHLVKQQTASPVVDLMATLTSVTQGYMKITDRSSTFAPHDSSVSTDHSLSTITDASSATETENPSEVPSSTITDSSKSITEGTYAPKFHSSTRTPDYTPIFVTITAEPSSSSSSSSSSYSPLPKTNFEGERTESKISDIQVEVYDSTVEPILASTNFNDNPHARYPSSHATTKQIPNNNQHQERFTQYVVDKVTDLATQDTNTVAKASGKPEPAAIEIHINVSEGFGNESEDLEFSYRQSDYRKASSEKPGTTNFITLKPFDTLPQNETSNEAAEEIVVEIIDSSSNSTENSASRENVNVNPIFTFRADDSSQVELKNVKYYAEDRPKMGSHATDDFFVPHVGKQPHSLNKPLADRDSDTIFYISNTEVKVGESLPTTNTYDAQMKKSRLESQFFPASYDERKKTAPQRYEEDIILSPLKNSIVDPLKVRGPLDISYVGESIIEVEQVTPTTTIPSPVPGFTPDVIIQPAVLPEMAIGVPVIGELPPQIELKEIDFMPNFDGNKEESSIQYGGDLIDEGGAMGAAFDMDSYPLGNLGLGHKSNIVSSQSLFNHRVNHLKKDELTADLAGSSETAVGNESVNGTLTGERIGNATAYSVMEEPPAGDKSLSFSDVHMLLMACSATLLPLVLSVFLAFGLRHLYRKYHTNPFNVMGHNSSTDPLDVEKGAGDGEEVQTPEELCASSLAYANKANLPPGNIDIRPDSSRQANGKTTGTGGSVPSRDCNGCVARDRSSPDTNVDGIQTMLHDEEETRRTLSRSPASATVPAQSSTKSGRANSAATGATVATSQAGTTGTMQCNYSGANGSITTMTLKNNHLIVETEERNDISRDARETKMHYNNSEKDGVFVVEVSRGVDSKCMPSSPVDDKPAFTFDGAAKAAQSCIQEKKPSSNHEEVQIHPPPVENTSTNGDTESNHLHQIDEVDESTEDGPKITKHSNTGLSQSDLSSTSSVDSNKRYSYGNQELYTIEHQDYTTPSQAATKAPHPPQPKQPENHNDDNGHSENGHCLENDTPTTPNCDSSNQVETDPDADGLNEVESKPKITAALLKQDTVICNEMTNGNHYNGILDEDEPTPHNSMEDLSNGEASNIMKVFNTTIVDYPDGDIENGFDSIISLPDPPSTEEIKQMNDIILMETNQLDSLPPPPPPTAESNNNTDANHHHHNGNGNALDQNGDVDDEDIDDSHSIASGRSSHMNTPTKLAMISTPPTITVATALPPTDIPHTNGNCMTGHTTAASAAAVVEVSGSS